MAENREYSVREMLIEIEDFIRQWDGTDIGYRVRNMLDNSDRTEESLKEIIEIIDAARG